LPSRRRAAAWHAPVRITSGARGRRGPHPRSHASGCRAFDLDRVVDLFERQWCRPRLLLQFGCSGGGHVGLAVSEAFHDRVDGTVAVGTHTPVWLMNTFLDGWFALKALLTEHYVAAGFGDASDLMISGLPNDGSAHPSAHGMVGRIPDAWRNAFRAAHATPVGRARMVLAFALAQWSPWLELGAPEPDLADVDALAEAVFRSALQIAQSPGGEARIMFENAAQGRQPSWNEGVDYAASYRNAAPAIPVFRMHLIGDYQVPYSLALGYVEALSLQGRSDAARVAFVKRTGHCNFTEAETATAVDVLLRRIETGAWPDTTPEALDARAASLASGSSSAFTDIGAYRIGRYNRLWLPPRSA
jgi:hypothetical protein